MFISSRSSLAYSKMTPGRMRSVNSPIMLTAMSIIPPGLFRRSMMNPLTSSWMRASAAVLNSW